MKLRYFGAAALCFAVVTFATSASAANTYTVNPAGTAYRYSAGVAAYGKPGGMVIAGNCNWDEAPFTQARANGAELIRYIAPVNVLMYQTCPEDVALYGSYSSTPKWPYPTPGTRTNFLNTMMTDIRAGSVWSNKVVAYVEAIMREGKVDGVFLDVVGGRLWTALANWESWPQWERDAWTDGNIDLVRRLDASRRAINPRFIIMNNGVWDRGDARGFGGEKYVDGVILEHHAATSAYHRNYAAKPFSNLGHRRVVVIGRSTADAQAWVNNQGVTHVSDNWTYLQVTPPPVAFTRLTDRPERVGRSGTSGVTFTPGMAMNYQRGSKFWLTEKGRLFNMAAYLDGNGGPTGSQNVRMAIYKDNAGKPGALVAQSAPLSVAAATGPRWTYFWGAQQVAINPGAYWVMVHSGSANAVSRIAQSGPANWAGTTDMFSDGPANPAPAGSVGTTTANVFMQYTRGQ